jgi:hypothetical protein
LGSASNHKIVYLFSSLTGGDGGRDRLRRKIQLERETEIEKQDI